MLTDPAAFPGMELLRGCSGSSLHPKPRQKLLGLSQRADVSINMRGASGLSTSAKFLPAEAQAGSAPSHRCCALRCLCRLHLFPVLHPSSNPSDFIPHLFLLSIIPFRTISCIRNQGNSNQGISHSPSPCLISDVASLTAPLPL